MVMHATWRISKKSVEGWGIFNADETEIEDLSGAFVAVCRMEYANLITACPEMLTVLKTTRGTLKNILTVHNYPTFGEVLAQIETVIANAERTKR